MLVQLPRLSFSCYQGYVLIFRNRSFRMWYVLTTECFSLSWQTKSLFSSEPEGLEDFKSVIRKITKCISYAINDCCMSLVIANVKRKKREVEIHCDHLNSANILISGNCVKQVEITFRESSQAGLSAWCVLFP